MVTFRCVVPVSLLTKILGFARILSGKIALLTTPWKSRVTSRFFFFLRVYTLPLKPHL